MRVGMSFIDGVSRDDKLTFFTFEHYTYGGCRLIRLTASLKFKKES